MSETYTFYYPDRTKISSLKAFVDFYSNEYFRDCFKKSCDSPDGDSIPHIKGLHRCSRIVECKVEEIRKKEDPLNLAELPLLLAWKIGKIAHKKSDDEKKVVFASDWETHNNNDEYCVSFSIPRKHQKQTQTISCCDIIQCINKYPAFSIKKKDSILPSLDNQTICFLEDLTKINGIGPTYAITILYFASKGIFPIYDRFADKAITAICKGLEPYSDFSISTMTNKNCFSLYQSYIEKIKMLNIYNRELDQALWAYGHLFNKSNREADSCC